MSVMVTDGTGFIHARVVLKLVQRCEEVVCSEVAPLSVRILGQGLGRYVYAVVATPS